MAAFRLYFLGFKDAIQARQDFTADNDNDAKTIAKLLWRACIDCYQGYELWQTTRRLACENNEDMPVAPPAIEHLAPPLQERVLELQEELLGSHWRAAQSMALLTATTALRRSLHGDDTATLLYRDVTHYICATTGSTMMSLQMADGAQLRLCGSRGFDRLFDEYFAIVDGTDCACGAALKNASQTVVPAIDSSPIYAGRQSLDVLRAQGAASCVSTPLLGGDGRITGMFSILRPDIWNPADGELARLRHIARQITAAMANPLCAGAQRRRAAV